MFNSLQQTYTLYKPTKTTNSLNEDIITYESAGSVQCFIGLNTKSFEKGSPQEVLTCEYCGWTSSTEIERDDRIDDYQVKYVIPASNQIFFYCSRVE